MPRAFTEAVPIVLSGGIRPPSPRQRDPFLGFDSTFITEGETPEKVLAEQPNRHPERYGMLRAITPSWGLWGPDGNPSEQLCRQLARQYAMFGVQLIALDMEGELIQLPPAPTPFTAAQRLWFHNLCQRWIPALKWMKAEVPGGMYTLFALPPLGDDDPTDSPMVRAEKRARDQMAIGEGLIEACDVLCPEFYIDHPVPQAPDQTWDFRQANWERGLPAVVEECHSVFYKRCLPYVCAHPRNAATQDVADLMPGEIWTRQTAAVRQIADGWCLWGWRSWQDSPAHMKAITDVLLPPG